MTIDYQQCTVVMTTYGNADFTNASVWALRRFYPNLRVIFADGHPVQPFQSWPTTGDFGLVWLPGACTEDCRNAAVACVETPYVLFMDNDCKVIGPDAIPLCLEAFTEYPKCAASGWYGLVVKDWERREAYVGTDFTDHMQLDATQATFSIHATDVYRTVGGMPKEPFWPSVPKELWLDVKLPAYTGDFTICREYKKALWEVVSPRKALPILHWTQAVAWMSDAKSTKPFDTWWAANTTHIRISPLNRWREVIGEEKKDRV